MLKLNCGISRKVGEPDYGSRGASINLELELDSSLIREPDKLQGRIEYLFRLARQSVDGELNGQNSPPQTNGRHQPSGGRHATQSQLRAIRAIAGRLRIDVGKTLQQFGVQQADELSISQASELIDELKVQVAGTGARQ